ncbi:MAG: polysaccharide biosynthesis tyrosine autokinase [Pseudomonadota bacterium]
MAPVPHGYGAGYPQADQSQDDLATALGFYVRVVFKRKLLIASSAAMALAIGLLIVLSSTPQYTAVTRVQIDRKAQQIVANDASSASVVGTNREFLRTQYELLKSRGLAERVVSVLQLQNDQNFITKRSTSVVGFVRTAFAGDATAAAIKSPIALQAKAVSLVRDNVAIRPVPGSRLVDLSFTDPDRDRAKRVADAYADAYIASQLNKRFQANAYAKTFLEDQIKQLKLRLEQSEQALLKFAERAEIVQVNEDRSIAESNLAAANTTLGELITGRIKNEQLWRQVSESDEIAAPQLLTNSVIDGLRAQKKALATEFEEKREIFKPAYPEMAQIKSKITETDRQLAAEVVTIKKSLKAAYETSVEQEKTMRARIARLQERVLSLQRSGVQHGILEREVETNRKLYNSLLRRLGEVDVASSVGTSNVVVVDRAERPSRPSEPRMGRALALALALGLAFGVGAAYVLEVFDDRVRVPEELEGLTRLPTLGIIPKLSSDVAFKQSIDDPRSPLAEAYRSLSTALQFSTEVGLPRSLFVTSSGPSEGKSSTAIAIARHFATLGMRVLLVDGDLRKPSLHAKLGRDNTVGLSNYLTGALLPREAFQSVATPGVTFMASGPIPPNPADVLTGPRMRTLVEVGLETFDVVIIDGPLMLGLADAQVLSNACAATLLVVASGQPRKGAIVHALRQLSMSRARVIGTVLTRFDVKASGYGYGGGHSYAYATDYGERVYIPPS